MEPTDPDLVSRVVSIVGGSQKLIEQQLILFRREIEGEIRKARSGAISMAVGAVIVAVAGIVLVLMMVHIVNAYTAIPLWGCYGLVAGVLAALGTVLLYFGGRSATTVSLFPPPQTMQALKESLVWLKNPENVARGEKQQSRVGQGLEEIHAQMAQIRATLTENLEAVQNKVRGKVEPAQVRLEKAVEAVKKTLAPGAAVKSKLTKKYEVEQALWLALGLSALAGYGMIWLIRSRRADLVQTNAGEGGGQVADLSASESTVGSLEESIPPGQADQATNPAAKELAVLQRVVLSVVMSLLRDWLMETLPKLAPQIEELMNKATRELGSQPIAGSLLRETVVQDRLAP
jgi:hypothetical protein